MTASSVSNAISLHTQPELLDRFRGALMGLAMGDALGSAVEFKRPGTFAPVRDMRGGGPFKLAAGQWTDDTSMALCLAESLIECRGFNVGDQMQRYVRWWKEGHLSSTGTCFDIGSTVRRALASFESTGRAYSGLTDPDTAGNGSLMRLAPVPMFFVRRPEEAIARAAASSRTTHGTRVAVDACRYFAGLIVGALGGASKGALLSPHFSPVPRYWEQYPLHPVIAAIAGGSFARKEPPAIRGSGYAAESLEAALWAFHKSESFRAGCLLAVNLGDDADTTGAIFGQLAGAFYGEEALPHEWRNVLAQKGVLRRYAERLYVMGMRD